MEYVGLGMYGLFFLWLIWLFHRENKDRQISALRTIPDAEPAAGSETPTEAAGENLQGQHG